MQTARSARDTMVPMRDSVHSTPRVVVAGEFSSGKSSLINLLLRQPVLDLSVGLSVHPPIRLHYGPQNLIMAHHWDGTVRRAEGVAEATANPEVSEIELTIPFEQFPGVEIVELPPPNGSTFPEPHRTTAATADLLIWCTIGSQAWRLTEKDTVATLGRGPDRPTILAVMRDDLIRSDEDRGKITRRLETEARPFCTDIVFVAASQKQIGNSTDKAVWEACGGGAIARSIAGLPGADAQPPHSETPLTVDEPEEVKVKDETAPVSVVVPMRLEPEPMVPAPTPLPSLVPTTRPEPDPEPEPIQAPAALAPSGPVDVPVQAPAPAAPPTPPVSGPDYGNIEAQEDALDVVLGAVSSFPGYRYSAVVKGAAVILEHNPPADKRSINAARLLFLAQNAALDRDEQVREIIIRGKNELHMMWDIGDRSHIHLVMHPSTTTLSSVKATLRDFGALGGSKPNTTGRLRSLRD